MYFYRQFMLYKRSYIKYYYNYLLFPIILNFLNIKYEVIKYNIIYIILLLYLHF